MQQRNLSSSCRKIIAFDEYCETIWTNNQAAKAWYDGHITGQLYSSRDMDFNGEWKLKHDKFWTETEMTNSALVTKDLEKELRSFFV